VHLTPGRLTALAYTAGDDRQRWSHDVAAVIGEAVPAGGIVTDSSSRIEPETLETQDGEPHEDRFERR
jgi:hypothetical protein